MSFLDDMRSRYAALGFDPGVVDLLAIVRDSPQEGYLLSDAGDIRASNLIAASSFSLNLEQSSTRDDRMAGEGGDPMHFTLGQVKVRASVKMPLRVPVTGFVDHAFATLWDAALLGHWGTANSVAARLTGTAPLAVGTTLLPVTNIADFTSLPTPFALTLQPEAGSSQTAESRTVTTVNKTARTLTLGAGTGHTHTPDQTRLYAKAYTAEAPEREPAFSLYSLREGMLAPCLVDKITIDVDIDRGVDVSVELTALGVHRDRQIGLREESATIRAAFGRQIPSRILFSTGVRVTPLAANSGDFGLAGAIGSPLFSGFQGLAIPNALLTGFSITIDNALAEVYTAHSVSLDAPTRQRENSYPFAIYSQGGKVSGTLRYRGPMEPWAMAEKLAGPSSLNGGGLQVDFGTFKIRLYELAWAPSKSEGSADGYSSREVSWMLLSETFETSPILENSQQS